MSENKGKRKKRPKSYYIKCANSKRRCFGKLDIGMKGFLVTCNNREKEAVRETYSILNEFADTLYGPEVIRKADSAQGSSAEESDEDVEDAIQNAIKEIKDSKTVERRFKSVDTNAKNCLFIKTLIESPNDLTSEIYKTLWSTKVQKSRYICRLLPILGTCRANTKEILTLAEKVLEPFFRTPFGKVTTYEISFKVRNNGSLNRSEILDMMNKLIKDMNTSNKVKLDKPEFVVLVEIVCNVCCLGIVHDFYKYKKCNLYEMSKSSDGTAKECSDIQKETANTGKVEEPTETFQGNNINMSSDNTGKGCLDIQKKTATNDKDEKLIEKFHGNNTNKVTSSTSNTKDTNTNDIESSDQRKCPEDANKTFQTKECTPETNDGIK